MKKPGGLVRGCKVAVKTAIGAYIVFPFLRVGSVVIGSDDDTGLLLILLLLLYTISKNENAAGKQCASR